MKRKSILLLIVFLSVFLCSCEKTPVEQWSRFYGFAKSDVVGHYEANPDQSVYEELPTEGVTIYPTATVDIIDLSGDMVTVRVTIPDVLNQAFSNVVESDENSSDMDFNNFNETLHITVYKDADNRIRLHGSVRQQGAGNDQNGFPIYTFYGFDVIKTE